MHIEVGWWSAFIENVERYDKTNNVGDPRREVLGVVSFNAILITEISRKVLIRIIIEENEY